MRQTVTIRLVVIALVMCVGAAIAPQAQMPVTRPAAHRVLAFLSCQPRQPVCADGLAAMAEVLSGAGGAPAELYVEYMDVPRLGAPVDGVLVARYLASKYAASPPDVVIADGDVLTDLFMAHRASLWPGVPVLAVGVAEDAPEVPGVIRLTRTEVIYKPAETVAAALRMLPGTRRVVYVGGAGRIDTSGRDIFRAQMREHLPAVPVVELMGLPIDETLRRVAALPEDSVVYTFGIFVDGRGNRYVAQDTANRIIAAANRPVFGLQSSGVGTGAVGGILSDAGSAARHAAHAARAVLRGEDPSRVPAVSAPRPMFDWRQLRRWGIDEATLPPGSLVLFREPSFVERYRWWIALAAFQLALITILLVERNQRVRASHAAAASESLNRSVIASLPGRIAVLDASGTILQVNATWAPPPHDDPGAPLAGASPGSNVRAAWQARGVDAATPALLEAIDDVLHGHAAERRLEFAHAVGEDPRFFRWLVQALDRPEGGAIVSLVDITARKRAELEGRRSVQEVAHAARVVSLGELTASLAHEINQPLGAILANAESGERVLASSSPDLPLLGDILRDIAASSERAGEVIRRMRTMLRKGDTVRVPVDVNALVHDIQTLLTPEAQLRRVRLDADMADDVPLVLGDAVQLQQVLLNLVINALDAIGDDRSRQHAVVVRTRRVDGAVELAVEDDGPGVPPHQISRLFEPFFTTKAQGLGMGLAIIRSIVEAHGGTIAAAPNDGPGMTFRCRLPAA